MVEFNKAGYAYNVIPGQAEVWLNCRLTMDQGIKDICKTLKEIAGPEIGLNVEVMESMLASESEVKTLLFQCIRNFLLRAKVLDY